MDTCDFRIGENFANYEILGRLSSDLEGAYAKIYKVRNETGNIFLAKVLIKKDDTTDITSFKREFDIVRSLDSPYVIKAYDFIEFKNCCIIIFEYATRGDLFTIIEKFKFSEDERISIFKEILEGVNYCHKMSVFHRDIKPENIVYSDKGTFKLIDFGMAQIGEPCNGENGTYIPYEASTPNYNCAKADIYALGIIFFMLFTKEFIFHPDNKLRRDFVKDEKYLIKKNDFSPDWLSEKLSTDKYISLVKYIPLLKGMLAVNPCARWSIDEIINFLDLEIDDSTDTDIYMHNLSLIKKDFKQGKYIFFVSNKTITPLKVSTTYFINKVGDKTHFESKLFLTLNESCENVFEVEENCYNFFKENDRLEIFEDIPEHLKPVYKKSWWPFLKINKKSKDKSNNKSKENPNKKSKKKNNKKSKQKINKKSSKK